MKLIRRLYELIERNIITVLVFAILGTVGALYWIEHINFSSFASKPMYHFYFVGQNSVDPFWKEIRKGIESGAREYNVVVEFNSPRFNNPEEEIKYLDIGILSKVDGIITHVSNGLNFTSLIDKAYERGIPVVTIENDDKNSNRNAFVGTNSFLLGKEAAKLMIEATNGIANIAYIVSNDFELDNINQNLKINGFLSTIKDYPDMRVVKTYTSKMGILSAEDITQSIINDESEINAILTMNYVDTLGAAQLIVDHNKVGKIQLVGHGDTENILRYIKKGIIYGTVVSDPYLMGYESLKALIDIKGNNNVSTFIDTGVKVITSTNVDKYEEEPINME